MPAAPVMARFSCWLTDDTSIPTLSEKHSVFIKTKVILQNSPAVTPPIVSVMASTGKTASTP